MQDSGCGGEGLVWPRWSIWQAPPNSRDAPRRRQTTKYTAITRGGAEQSCIVAPLNPNSICPYSDTNERDYLPMFDGVRTRSVLK